MRKLFTKSVFIALIAILSAWNLNAQEMGTITLSANPPQGGHVVPSGTLMFELGSHAYFMAIPNLYWNFINWTEDGVEVSTDAMYTFTVTGDRHLVANFVQVNFNILLSQVPVGGGTVTGGGLYEFGISVTVTATPHIDYEFLRWEEDGQWVTMTPEYQFSINRDRHLSAIFGPITTFEITVSANPPDYGTVSGGGSYTIGDMVTITAESHPDYIFLNWTENGNIVSSDIIFSFPAYYSRNLVANFAPATCEITLSKNIEGVGTLHGAGTYNYGQMAIVYAADFLPEYKFDKWTEDGNIVSYGYIISAFPVKQSRHLVANFKSATYEVVIYANPFEGGTVTGGGEYPYGASATISATANEEYKFLNWTKYVLGNGTVVSTEPDYTFVVTGGGNVGYVAYFEPKSKEELFIEPIDPGAMMIYPNPTTGELRMDASAGSTTNAELIINNVEIFDLAGRKVYQQTINQSYGTLKLNELAQGAYILKVYLDQGDVVTWRVVKN